MFIAHTIQEMRHACRSAGRTPGLVPTMGALHEGHRSLVRRARRECGLVAVSLFVNPLQFAAGEDLDVYPRTFEADCRMLEEEGVDLLFAPSAAEMYPGGAGVTTVHVGEIGDRLDGSSRPGHFVGVATVVAKLFHIVAPNRAYFGQKDAAQLAVLRRMVRDLDFDLEIIPCPIVRDLDGLALSSRNRYLTPEERGHALVLPRVLQLIERQMEDEVRDAATLRRVGQALLDFEPGVVLDYLEIVDADTLLPIPEAVTGALIAVAAKVGGTRLIDNLLAP